LTSGSRGRALRGAALALVGLLPAPARALDVKLWPLFRYAHDKRTDEVRWTALGPLIEFSRTAEFRDLRVRPLLWLHQRRGPVADDRAEILYPLAGSRWQERYQSFRFLLFTYRTAPEPSPGTTPTAIPPPSEWPSRFTLFPFIFYRHSPERGTFFGVLPFYLDLPDFLGYTEVKAVMFPAYLRLTEPRVERRFYGFPFVSTVGGADGRGLRVWPFYGTKEIVGQERTSYVLWPFHVRSERLVPGYGWEQQRVDFPFFAALDGPTRHSRAYGIVAYTHTVDERLGYEAIGSPWPVVFRDRALGDLEYRTWRFAPFYGRSERDGIASHFYGWPAWRSLTQDTDDFHYERQDALLLVWRRQAQRSLTSGHEERLLTLFPVLRREEKDDRHFGQSPALADSLMPKNRGVRAMWAPLYGIVRWDTAADGERDWNVLWGLVARERGHYVGPWHFDLGRSAEVGDGG
jgi:hypothetical protein